ncbi:MAG: peptidylprolyl isomerase [Clostridia bacterium]|nr:peptidylprolyl isomerase [Clostridia bacterium]
MKNLKKALIIFLTFSLMFTASCSSNEENKKEGIHSNEKIVSSSAEAVHTKVCFEVENYGIFTVETYPEYAPESVAHFLKLVKSGYYNGMEFSKINSGHSVVSSDVTVHSSGECRETVTGEFYKNGYSNEMPLTRGTLCFTYLPGEYNSARSQFMILLSDELGLEGEYAPFAKLIENSAVFDKIAAAELNEEGEPLSPIVMKNVYVK